jgi:uncharacterized protein YkwD
MKWIGIFLAWLLSIVSTKPIDPLVGYEMTSQRQIQKPTVTLRPNNKVTSTRPTATETWGVAKQIDEHTWTMKVGMDSRMATAEEILAALNDYRVRRGSQRLAIDSNLASYAQSRADYLNSIKDVDGHKGFSDFLDNQNGYEKLGFTMLGENISYGYRLEGVHIIEWMYAADKPHDDNQVDNRWNYVGIGVRGTATAIIFGTGKR